MYEYGPMLSHEGVWAAIDLVAKSKGLSTSALAKKAGLDATTFNSSKRVTAEGKRRWPSTESISKVLNVTGTSLTEFVSFTGDPGSAPGQWRLPIIRSAQAAKDGFFDEDGNPMGQNWDAVQVMDMGRDGVFALEVGGHGTMPVYRKGDIIVVSPSAEVRKGDRVVVKTTHGKILVRELIRRSKRRVELREFSHHKKQTVVQMDDVNWIARIIWAGQ